MFGADRKCCSVEHREGTDMIDTPHGIQEQPCPHQSDRNANSCLYAMTATSRKLVPTCELYGEIRNTKSLQLSMPSKSNPQQPSLFQNNPDTMPCEWTIPDDRTILLLRWSGTDVRQEHWDGCDCGTGAWDDLEVAGRVSREAIRGVREYDHGVWSRCSSCWLHWCRQKPTVTTPVMAAIEGTLGGS